LGYYRLRTRIKYTSGLDPCGTTTYGEVEDYSFELTPKVPNEWTGASNSYWNQPANWSLGHVPTYEEDVIINNVGYQPPIVAITDAECKNLTINTGAGVYVIGNTLTTNGNMTIFGQLSMVDSNGGIVCYGNVDWNNNSTANFTASTLFQVYGHWFFNSGANAQLNNGTVSFIGNGLSEIKSKSATCSLNSIYINKNYNALKIISDANQPLVINGDIYIQTNSGFSNDSQQDIICRGNLYNSGYYYLSDINKLSTFIFDGTNQYIFMFSANGYFNHLKVSPGVSLILGGDIHTAGNLTIESGTLDTQGHNIIVDGNWTNNLGPDAFIESTGRVIFSGTNTQYCSDEVFNILEIDNQPGALYVSGTNVVCAAYDWTAGTIDVFNNGVFTANDLIDNGIYGKFVLNDNSTINLTNYDGYVDLDGELYINGGTMNVYGGTTMSYWPYDANATLIMSDGILDFHDQGIYIYDSPTYSFANNIAGGIIRTSQGYIGARSDFTPTAGTFEFYGPDDFLISQLNGSTLFDVVIDKSAIKSTSLSPSVPVVDERSDIILSFGGKSNTTALGSDFVITNDLTITSGEFKLNGNDLTVSKDCLVYGTLTMDNNADFFNIGQDYLNTLVFETGSTANFLAGNINNYGWILPVTGCSFTASTNHTIYCKGVTGGGLTNREPTATYGNVVLDKISGQTTYISWAATEPVVLNGSFTINANNIFETQNSTMIVHGGFTDHLFSEIFAYKTTKSNEPVSCSMEDIKSGGSKDLDGFLEIDADFALKGLLDVGPNGHVIAHGVFGTDPNSSLIITGGSLVVDSPTHPGKGWEYYMGNLTLSSGIFEVTNNSILFNQYSTTNVSGGTIRCGGAFHASFGDTPGIFTPTGGVVEFIGTPGSYYIYCPVGNNFYDLRLNCYGCSMSFHDSPSVQVLNDVIIDGGFLNPGNISNPVLKVGGNWMDNYGGFYPSDGTVEFNGTNFSAIITNGTFYKLSVNKLYYDTPLVILDGLNVNVNNDLTINTGTLTIGNSTLNIAQNLTIHSSCLFEVVPTGTAMINIGGDWTNQNPSNSVNNGFYPGMSTVTFNGYADQHLYSNAGLEGFYNFYLDNGYHELYNYTNIECLGDFHAITGNMVDNYGSTSDGHTFWSDFILEENANVDFGSHILGFYGSNDATFWDASGNIFNSSNYGATIYIDKDNPSTLFNFKGDNASGLTVSSTIIINQGYVAPQVSLSANGGISTNGGTLLIDESVVLVLDGGLEINSGGTIELLGSNTNNAVVTNSISGSYTFDINNGGTIMAENVIFQGMKLDGIYIHDGAFIDPAYSFNNCTFQDFINPTATSAFLTIDNDQYLIIPAASFPDDGSAPYNIKKNVVQGQLTLENYSGMLSGEAFDSDPYNRINWIIPDLQLALTAFLEGPFNGSTMNTDLNNLAEFPLNQPFNTLPWNYSGSENITATPTGVVDWVLIELRDAGSAASAVPGSQIARQAALLMSNGEIKTLNGSENPVFSGLHVSENLFVIIWHRNHLGVMSAIGVSEVSDVYTYNFSSAAEQAYGDNQVNLGNGYFGLIAADINADGFINTDDLNLWKQLSGKTGYLTEDINLDSQVDNKDKNDFWYQNKNKFQVIPE